MIQRAAPNPEANIPEAELGGAGAAQVFAGAQKEEEANDKTRGRRDGVRGGIHVMCDVPHLGHQ